MRDIESGATVDMNIDGSESIEGVILKLIDYWNKGHRPFILKEGRRVLRGEMKFNDSGLENGAFLELLPDPEGG